MEGNLFRYEVAIYKDSLVGMTPLWNKIDRTQLKLNSECYMYHRRSGGDPEYLGKLTKITKSKDTDTWECVFEATTFIAIYADDISFSVTPCIKDFLNKKKRSNNEKKQRRNTLKKQLDACGEQKCGSLRTGFQNARAKLNGTNNKAKQNINAFFEYDKCLSKHCKAEQNADRNAMFTRKNWTKNTKNTTNTTNTTNTKKNSWLHRIGLGWLFKN